MQRPWKLHISLHLGTEQSIPANISLHWHVPSSSLHLPFLCFGVTVIFTGFFNTTNASELLSVESWVYINQVTYTCGVNAHTISVTVVWAILFSTIATTVTCVTFTFTVSHATSMESTFFIACSYATVWSSPSFFTLAWTFNTRSFGATVIWATFGCTIITSPHLTFERCNWFFHWVAFAFSGFDIAFTMFNVADRA